MTFDLWTDDSSLVLFNNLVKKIQKSVLAHELSV